MADKINIADFDFDPSRLEKGLREITISLNEAKQSQRTFEIQTKNVQLEIDKLAAATRRLYNEQEGLEKKGQTKTIFYEANKKEIEANVKQLNQLIAQTSGYAIKSDQLSKKIKYLNTEYKQTATVLDALHAVNELNIKDYTTEGKSIASLKIEYANLTKIRNQSADVEQIRLYNKAIDENIEAQKTMVSSSEERYFKIGEYQKELAGGFDEVTNSLNRLKSGDIIGAFEGIKHGFASITKAAWAFVTTPVGATLAILAGIALITTEWINYNAAAMETNRIIEQVAGTSGKATDELRLQGEVIQDVFNRDLKESVKELKILQDEFGLSSEDAFNTYVDGLVRGGAENEEFGNSIQEYSKYFAKAGFSGQEFINILNKGINLDTYKDKIPDAIKESYIALREQTKAAQDALTNAFGSQFTNTLLKEVEQGKITVKDALLTISEEAEKANLNQQQLAQLTADLFKGAGEDAGGALDVMKALREGINDTNKEYTDLQQTIVTLTDWQLKMKEAKDEALKSESLMAFQKQWEIVWSAIQTYFWKALSFIIEKWYDWNDLTISTTAGIIESFKNFPVAIGKIFTLIGKSFDTLVSSIMDGAKTIKNVLQFDFSAAKENFDKFKNGIKNNASDIINATSDIGNSFKDSFDKGFEAMNATLKNSRKAAAELQRQEDEKKKAAEEAEKERKKNQGEKEKALQAAEAAKQKEAAARQKAVQEEMKQAQERMRIAKSIADSNISIMKLELDEYIRNNASKLDNAKFISKELVKEENNRLNEILNRNLSVLAEEEKIKEEEIKRSVKNELERNTKLLELRKNYTNQRAKLSDETAKKIDDNEEKYDKIAQQRKDNNDLIYYQKRIQDLEAQGANEFQIKQEQLDFEFKNNQERKKVEDELNAILEEELRQQGEDINYELDQETLDRKLALQQSLLNIDYSYQQASLRLVEDRKKAELDAYANLAGGISKIAGEQTALGKAAAIAETTINTYSAIAGTLKAFSGIPIPGYAIAQAITTGVFGLAQVAKIAGVETPANMGEGIKQAGGAIKTMTNLNRPVIDSEGFMKGGYTGDIPINQVAGPVHGQEIVFSNTDIKMSGGVEAVEAMRPTSDLYKGGANPLNTLLVQQYITNTADLGSIAESVKQGVYEGSLLGTHAGSQQGISDYNDTMNIANGSNH